MFRPDSLLTFAGSKSRPTRAKKKDSLVCLVDTGLLFLFCGSAGSTCVLGVLSGLLAGACFVHVCLMVGWLVG